MTEGHADRRGVLDVGTRPPAPADARLCSHADGRAEPIGPVDQGERLPDEPLSPGDMLGMYRLKALLGKGGMGEVWHAEDTALERDVAIKVLPPLFKASREFRVRFKREAQAVARLVGKPHVIPIYHLDAVDCYLVMLYVEGTDLATLLRGADRAAGLPPEQAVGIVADVADALTSAHDAGLVHRDVKPSNVLVSNDGTVWLVDFGIVGAIDDELLTRLTEAEEVPGTYAYMAPERFATSNAAPDKRFDVYGLACVLYECLTGVRAFPEHQVALSVAHNRPDRPRPSEVAAHLAPFDDVVVRGLAVEPEDRFDSVAELADTARRALAEWTTVPEPAGQRPGEPVDSPSKVRLAVRDLTTSPLVLGAATGIIGGLVSLLTGLDLTGGLIVLVASYASGFSWATWRRARAME